MLTSLKRGSTTRSGVSMRRTCRRAVVFIHTVHTFGRCFSDSTQEIAREKNTTPPCKGGWFVLVSAKTPPRCWSGVLLVCRHPPAHTCVCLSATRRSAAAREWKPRKRERESERESSVERERECVCVEPRNHCEINLAQSSRERERRLRKTHASPRTARTSSRRETHAPWPVWRPPSPPPPPPPQPQPQPAATGTRRRRQPHGHRSPRRPPSSRTHPRSPPSARS
jgi:hypothetical protein